MTRALVLGVAQDGGHPQPGCDQRCCQGNVRPHLTTCVALVEGNRAWLLDAGPDLPKHLLRLGRKVSLQGILLTHAHIGHYAGLLHLGREAMNTSGLPVWAAPRMARFLLDNGPWRQLADVGNIDIRVMQPGKPIALTTDLEVTPFAVPHRDEYSETVGFKVAGSRRRLLYVPDTDGWDGWDPSVEERITTVDVALLDATFFAAGELPNRDMSEIGHPLVADSLQRFANLDDRQRRKIHFTHMNHSNPLLDPNSDEHVAVARSGMAVAAEGDVYEL